MYSLVLIGFVGEIYVQLLFLVADVFKGWDYLMMTTEDDLIEEPKALKLSLTGSLLEKIFVFMYGGAFWGMGKMVHLYFMNFFVFHFVYLLIIYVFIGFYLSLSGSL